jgi:hypothetical protein
MRENFLFQIKNKNNSLIDKKMFLESLIIVSGLILGAVYFCVSKNKRERIDFHGKHVVITGGSQGIGFELSLEAFKQGAHVSIVARNVSKLSEIRAELESLQKKNPTLSNQIIQAESLDISKSFEETKQVFDRVNFIKHKDKTK